MKRRSTSAHLAASVPEARWPCSLSISTYSAATPADFRLAMTVGARLGAPPLRPGLEERRGGRGRRRGW